MWIIHSDLSFQFLHDPITHMEFQLQLAKESASKWAGWKHGYSTFIPAHHSIHGLKSMGKKEVYVGVWREHTNQACLGCQVHICKGSCYWDNHW
jgi:hypothetical protein